MTKDKNIYMTWGETAFYAVMVLVVLLAAALIGSCAPYSAEIAPVPTYTTYESEVVPVYQTPVYAPEVYPYYHSYNYSYHYGRHGHGHYRHGRH